MLHGIDPILTGELLAALDRLGHGDTLLLVDANYPAYRAGRPVIDSALGVDTVLRAVRTVIPLDSYDGPSVTLMDPEPSDTGLAEAAHDALRLAADCAPDRVESLDRRTFYDAGMSASVVVRTNETRPYGNVIIRKGVVAATPTREPA